MAADGAAPRASRHPLWLAAYAVVTFLSFPFLVFGHVVDLGAALAWAGPALLIAGVGDLPPRAAARWAFAASLAAHAAILHWIWVVTVVYGHANPLVGVLGPLGLGAYIAGFSAGFGALLAWLRRAGLASPLAAAALWTALEHLRSFALSGFPWATLGYAQHQNPALLGLAPYTGVYGLSFVTVLAGAGLAEIAVARRARRRVPAGALRALAGAAAAAAAGLALGAATPADPPETVRVAVLQGNIDQGAKWSREWFEQTLDVYADLSRRAAAQGARVIVWPETAVPGPLAPGAPPAARLARIARESGALLVVGAVGIDWPEGAAARYFDSAFVVDGQGVDAERYDKSHLVPFGEYLPLHDWLGRFFQAVARGVATTGVSAGPGPRPLALPLQGEPLLTAGVPICYELIFPDVVRRFVREGAELLLAITNDAWYGRTGAPYQFLAITAVRSAETRVWTARAANTGVSAIIDATGRVRTRTRIFERDLRVADVPRRPPPLGGSFYTRHGDVFAGACWTLVAALVGAAARRNRRGRSA